MVETAQDGHDHSPGDHPSAGPNRLESHGNGGPDRLRGRLSVITLALLLLSGQVARAADLTTHTDDVVDVRRASIRTAAGLDLEVEGGTWMSTEQTMRTGRELVSLRAQRDALREAPPMPPLWTLGVALAVGLACGVAIGMAGR